MSIRAANALSVALSQGNIAEVMAEDREIFGPLYSKVIDFTSDYYSRYSQAPSIAEVNDHFDEQILEPKTEGNIKYELDALRTEYMRAEVESMITKLASNLDRRPIDEVLSRMVAKGTLLQRLTERVKDIDITDIDIAMDAFKAEREADTSGNTIMSGIDAWDTALPMGMRAGQSITFMGYSGKGKSFMADLVICNAYLQGKTVMLVSLEMSAYEQRARIWAILAKGKFLINDLAIGDIDEDDTRGWAELNLRTGGKIIVVEPDGHGDVTPASIQSKIDKYKPDMVVWDYLQLAMDNGKSKDMTPRMMNLSREIKLQAVTNRIVALSITAVTDDDGKKRDAPPRMAQIAWSKAIEYDSDLAIAIHKYDDSDILEIVARKVRRSPTFLMRYEVDLSRGVFLPMMGGGEDN